MQCPPKPVYIMVLLVHMMLSLGREVVKNNKAAIRAET
jgi:hypothetical protein